MASMEERASRLEDAFEQFSVVVHNMATKEELRASFESLRTGTPASVEGVRIEMRASFEGLRTEMQASFESLRTGTQVSVEGVRTEMQASIEKLRVEVLAEIRAAELRITRWTVGSIFAASAIIIAAMKLLP